MLTVNYESFMTYKLAFFFFKMKAKRQSDEICVEVLFHFRLKHGEKQMADDKINVLLRIEKTAFNV